MRLWLPWRRVLLTGLLLAGVSLYARWPNALYQQFERMAYDQALAWTQTAPYDERIVLLDIDEHSLRTLGPWPWPRARMAQLINQLTQHYRVALLGVDIVFPETKPQDAVLKAALSQPNIVLAQVLDFSPGSQNQAGQLADLSQPVPAHFPQRMTGFIANHPALLTPNAQVGHISPVIDPDGKVRRVYPLACGASGCSPALSLRLYQVLSGAQSVDYRLKQQTLHLTMPQQQTLSLPLDKEQALMIPYSVQTGGFRTVSASEVFHARLPMADLNNTIVLLGSTALGLGDAVATPTHNSVPGLELHAQLLSSLLDQSFITPQHGVKGWALPALGISLLYLLWPWRRARGLLIWLGGGLLLTLGLPVFLFWQYGFWLSFTPLPLLVFLLGLSGLITESMRLNQQLRGLARQFSRFIPANLVQRMLHGRAVGPNSEKRELSVLVADMRGFTTASEGKTPHQVAELAQKCLETLTQVVYQHGGTIEKYSGDGLMAIWGAPQPDSQHAQHAVAAGLGMQSAIDSLAAWFVAHHFQPMQVSVGINTGEMAVGVFGGEAHLAWTAHGDAVNVASRIEQLTRTVHENLLIGQRTAELYGLEHTADCGEHKVKGRQEWVQVYKVLSKKG